MKEVVDGGEMSTEWTRLARLWRVHRPTDSGPKQIDHEQQYNLIPDRAVEVDEPPKVSVYFVIFI